MLCNLFSGDPTGLPGGRAVPLTEEVGVVAGGEAKPPWPLGLTTVDDEGDTEGDAWKKKKDWSGFEPGTYEILGNTFE